MKPFVFSLLVLASGLVAGAAEECDVPQLAAGIGQACAPGVGTLAAPCCDYLSRAGGRGCLCRVASASRLLPAGLDAPQQLLEMFAACGGDRVVGSCNDAASTGSVLRAPLPSTASPTPSASLAAVMVPSGCRAETLAAEVATSCVAAVATPACCAPVVAAVDVGGGYNCLCRVAVSSHVVRAGISASGLSILYRACGGAHVIMDCHAATADRSRSLRLEAVPPTTVLSQKREKKKKASDHCNAHLLGDMIVAECNEKDPPSDRCCIAVVAAVDMKGCLCKVADDSSIVDAGENMTAHDVMKLYAACGGLRPLPSSLAAACKPEPTSEVCHLVKEQANYLLGMDVAQSFEDLVFLAYLGYKIYEYFFVHPQAPAPLNVQ